eukprot:1160625-Pelagomonas_calceolata.AAC.3
MERRVFSAAGRAMPRTMESPEGVFVPNIVPGPRAIPRTSWDWVLGSRDGNVEEGKSVTVCADALYVLGLGPGLQKGQSWGTPSPPKNSQGIEERHEVIVLALCSDHRTGCSPNGQLSALKMGPQTWHSHMTWCALSP